MSELHKLAEELGLEEVVYEQWTDLLGRPLDLREVRWITRSGWASPVEMASRRNP